MSATTDPVLSGDGIYIGAAQGDLSERLGVCDLKPGTKADGAREMWQRARRGRITLSMTITGDGYSARAIVRAVRRLPSGGTRIRFEVTP
jgi:hypothetical protein